MAVLHPGSWEAFEEWSVEGVFIPEELSEKIFLLLREEQIQEIGDEVKDRYIMGLKRASGAASGIRQTSTMIEYLENAVIRHCMVRHPGRFSFNRICRKLSPGRIEFDISDEEDDLEPPLPENSFRQRETDGFQDVYFLGGLPLQYWSFEDQMGMKLPDGEMTVNTEWVSANWMWRGKGDAVRWYTQSISNDKSRP